MMATLDLVIPVYNEAEAVGGLFDALDRTFSPANLASRQIDRVRYVMIDDGSSDATARIIADRIRQGAPAALYRFSRNFGHMSAICAGLDCATADLVAVLDADLQDPPEVVLDMVDKAREGYNVVFGIRRRRQEPLWKRIGNWAFNRLIGALSDVTLPMDSGEFCLMDRQALKALRELPERLRFPRVLRAWVGFRQGGVEYDRPERLQGTTKYSFTKYYRLATDGIAASSIRPLRIAQWSTFLMLIATSILMVTFLVILIGFVEAPLPLPFLVTYFLITSGNALMLLSLTVMNAYVGRMYLEVKGRPTYIVMEVIEGAAK